MRYILNQVLFILLNISGIWAVTLPSDKSVCLRSFAQFPRGDTSDSTQLTPRHANPANPFPQWIQNMKDSWPFGREATPTDGDDSPPTPRPTDPTTPRPTDPTTPSSSDAGPEIVNPGYGRTDDIGYSADFDLMGIKYGDVVVMASDFKPDWPVDSRFVYPGEVAQLPKAKRCEFEIDPDSLKFTKGSMVRYPDGHPEAGEWIPFKAGMSRTLPGGAAVMLGDGTENGLRDRLKGLNFEDTRWGIIESKETSQRKS